MRLFFIAAVFCLSSADKLDNTYLPPQGAQGAGGGPGLATPFGGPRPGGGNEGGGPRPQYGAPSGGGGPGGPAGGGAGGGSGEQIPIISMENVNNGDGSYKWSYETGNGIKAQEEGELKPGGEEGIQSVKGSYSYTGPDGQEIKVEYTADENGFVPKGDHLPTSPPIPPEILKSLEQNAAEEAAGGGQGGAGQGGQGGYPSGGPSGGGYPGSGGGGQNGYRY